MPVIEVVQRIEVPDVPDIDLPYDDGEPLESNWHRLQINVLGDALHQHWQDRADFFAGGNMFVYYSLEQARTRDYKGPDFFVVTGVDGSRSRHSWIVWQEGGRYPEVIVELLSPTTMAQDLGPKKELYERVFRTSEYFCVNPDDWSLRGWHLANRHYVALQPDARGWLWSDTLQLWLGLQEGRFQGTTATWLRFFTRAGVLVPTGEENAEAARWQAENIHHTLGGDMLSDADSVTIYNYLHEAAAGGKQTTFKAVMPSSQVAAFYQKFDQLPIKMIARAANGIVYGIPSTPLDESVWQALLEQAVAGQGNLQIRGPMPGPFINRFGSMRADWAILQRIQKAFDPQGTFAPERLFGT